MPPYAPGWSPFGPDPLAGPVFGCPLWSPRTPALCPQRQDCHDKQTVCANPCSLSKAIFWRVWGLIAEGPGPELKQLTFHRQLAILDSVNALPKSPPVSVASLTEQAY